MKKTKILFYNLIILITFLVIIESIFGYWFSENNFGIYMRKERKLNIEREMITKNFQIKHFYKRNFYGFRGEEFNPTDVKIIFNGGSTGNEEYTPEKLTIVGNLNKYFENDNIKIKIYNASTNGKSTAGFINDFLYWFPKIPNLQATHIIFYLGINDVYRDQTLDHYDYKVSISKIDKLKDYIKNNSLIVDRYKKIKNKYFPSKDTIPYGLYNENLYDNFSYHSYLSIKNNTLESSKEKFVMQYINRLNNLNLILQETNIVPIFITQIEFDGLRNNKLFLINKETKKFAKKNNYLFIPLDEIAIMEEGDFYDPIHTTPQGSKKIAKLLYPYLKKFLTF